MKLLPGGLVVLDEDAAGGIEDLLVESGFPVPGR